MSPPKVHRRRFMERHKGPRRRSTAANVLVVSRPVAVDRPFGDDGDVAFNDRHIIGLPLHGQGWQTHLPQWRWPWLQGISGQTLKLTCSQVEDALGLECIAVVNAVGLGTRFQTTGGAQRGFADPRSPSSFLRPEPTGRDDVQDPLLPRVKPGGFPQEGVAQQLPVYAVLVALEDRARIPSVHEGESGEEGVIVMASSMSHQHPHHGARRHLQDIDIPTHA